MYKRLMRNHKYIVILGLVLALAGALASAPVSYVVASGGPTAPRALTPLDLGTLPGGTNSVAKGINSAGDVVGYSDTASGDQHAFLYKHGTMTDLGTLPGGSFSIANGINQTGAVVGYSDTASGNHAFLYEHGTMTDLGTLPGGFESIANGINSAGAVVGVSYT